MGKVNIEKLNNKYSGNKYNRLTIIKFDRVDITVHRNNYFYHCLCDCGNEKSINIDLLKNGDIKSCGCLKEEYIANRFKGGINKNNYIYLDTHVEINIKGKIIKCDYCDLEMVKKYHWNITNGGYVYTASIDNKNTMLHRKILNLSDCKTLVDHINHDTLDNRRFNLRIVDHSQNAMNSKLNKTNTSGYKGVRRDSKNKKWQAFIYNSKNKLSTVGFFDNLEDAVKARKEAEIKYYGEYRYDINNDVTLIEDSQ